MTEDGGVIAVGRIEQLIFMVRGHRVMLDRDLARLYGVETRALNQAVRRNVNRFPSDFMLSLTREEIKGISQIVISSEIKFSKRVHAFTEQGVAMLSSVLRSRRAIGVNIEIMRAFVRVRELLAANRELSLKFIELERRVASHDEHIQAIFAAIRQLMSPPPTRAIGFHARERPAPYGKRKQGWLAASRRRGTRPSAGPRPTRPRSTPRPNSARL